MKKIRVWLSLVVVVLSFITWVCSSCKTTSRRHASNSTLLSISDPESITQFIVGRKVVAVSTVSGCSSVVFPFSSEDLDDLSSYGEVSANNGISLHLDKACLPYEVTLSYKCKEYDNGKYPAGRCFVGKASTFTGTIFSDSMTLKIPLEGIGEWANIKVEDPNSFKIKDFFTANFLKNNKELPSANKAVYVLSGVQDVDVKGQDVGDIKFSGANTSSNDSSKDCGFEWDKSYTDVVIISKINIDGKDFNISSNTFEKLMNTQVTNSLFIYAYSGSVDNKSGSTKFMCESKVFRVEFGG